MKWNKANLAGLTSLGQQSEMKAILVGTWPPLKPLPVFKYETAEYRATIDFDKKRGEWACRKTSLPSNEVQELRGGLREITMALPHGETETFIEGAELQEPEFEKDAHRRLQAIREWKEKYENGALYFELRGFLSESQRTELDDSMRLALTARQLQFNSKNAANVFDDLSIAGGRFAALIEFAKRNKAKEGTDASAQEGVTRLAAEDGQDNDKQSMGIGSPEFTVALSKNDVDVPEPETSERYAEAAEFPALSIKHVFPEQELTPLADRTAHAASPRFDIEKIDIEASQIAPEDSPPLAEPSHADNSHQEARHSPVFTGFAAQVPAGQSFADPIAGSPSRFPALKISAFQANAFALLFLFAVTSFAVGLTVGRGPLGKRLREAPKSLLAADAKPPTPTLPDAAEPFASDESSPQAPTLPPANSDDSAGAKKPAAAPSGEKPTVSEGNSNESTRGSDLEEVRSTNSDSSAAKESTPPVESEVNPEPARTIGPVARVVSPPASPKLVRPSSKRVRRPKVVSRTVRSSRSVPRSTAPYRLASTIAATPHTASASPHVTRSSTILVTVPDRGGQPFRVSFPNKTIAATSSLAMTAQLSVLVTPEPGPSVAPKSARLEAGELVSFGWPRYSGSGHNGLAETIRVRVTIGLLGQVQEVRSLGGSASLLPATMETIRQWRYTPTLLDRRPVQAQQDITIEFRPPQYTARLSTQHLPHN